MDNNELKDENKKPIGSLFDTINYYSMEDLDKFTSNITHEQAIYCLVEAVQAGFRRNIYDMTEIEVISKVIRKLSINN
jgi:hypothetical protein